MNEDGREPGQDDINFSPDSEIGENDLAMILEQDKNFVRHIALRLGVREADIDDAYSYIALTLLQNFRKVDGTTDWRIFMTNVVYRNRQYTFRIIDFLRSHYKRGEVLTEDIWGDQEGITDTNIRQVEVLHDWNHISGIIDECIKGKYSKDRRIKMKDIFNHILKSSMAGRKIEEIHGTLKRELKVDINPGRISQIFGKCAQSIRKKFPSFPKNLHDLAKLTGND